MNRVAHLQLCGWNHDKVLYVMQYLQIMAKPPRCIKSKVGPPCIGGEGHTKLRTSSVVRIKNYDIVQGILATFASDRVLIIYVS